MYEELDCFERALQHFGTRVEIITAMEMANKIKTEDAYQQIKEELKELKYGAGGQRASDEAQRVRGNDEVVDGGRENLLSRHTAHVCVATAAKTTRERRVC